jgi:Na+-driven multidrug efflux pump
MFNNKLKNIDKEINKNLFTYFRYAITTMISILIFRSSAIIDTIFTGHYISATGLAAMGLILPIDTFCLAIIQSLTSGSIVVMGGYLGERNFAYFASGLNSTKVRVIFISSHSCI